MNLQELKKKSPTDLLAFAEELEVENASSLRRQDMMFAILKELADGDEEITGGGVLEEAFSTSSSSANAKRSGLDFP